MNRHPKSARALFIAALAIAPLASAQTSWTGTTNTNINTATNWSLGLPSATVAGAFPAVASMTNGPTMNAGITMLGLSIDNSGGYLWNLGGTNTLSLGANGLSVTGGASTITAPLASVTAPSTLGVTSSGTLNVGAYTGGWVNTVNNSGILNLTRSTAGTFALGTASAAGSANSYTITNSGTLTSDANMTLSLGNGTSTSAASTITNGSTGIITFSGPVALNTVAAGGSHNFVSNNLSSPVTFNGLVTFSGAVNFSGPGGFTFGGSVVNAGSGSAINFSNTTVTLNRSIGGVFGGIGSSPGRTINFGANTTVNWSASNQFAGTGGSSNYQLVVGQDALINLNGFNDSFAWSGNDKITLSGGTISTGAGVWTMTGNNAQNAIVNGTKVSTITGIVDINIGASAGTRNTAVSDTAVGLDLDIQAVVTNTTTGAGGFNFLRGGTTGNAEVRLSGNNTFNGALTIASDVTLYADNASAMGATATGTTVSAGGTLVVRNGLTYAAETISLPNSVVPGLRSTTGNNTLTGQVSLGTGGAATIQVDADSLIFASGGSLQNGSRPVTKQGPGAIQYNNTAVKYSGQLYLNDGTFAQVPTGEVNTRGANTVLNGGTLGSPDNNTMALGTGSNNVRYGANGGGYAAFGADMSVDVGGATTLVWGGGTVANTLSTTISGGAITSVAGVLFGGSGYNGTEAVTFTAAPSGGTTATGTITVVNGVVTAVNITSGGSGYTAAPTATIAVPTRDGGTVNYLPNGAPLILNSLISAHRVTMIDNIDLAAATASFTGNREIRVLDNTASTNDRAIINGVISSSKAGIGVNKTGAGLLELPSAVTNTYSGPTNVNAGTLLVNGTLGSAGSGTGSNVVTVATGATLGGSGTINRSVTVNTGGTLAPGNSPGILTVNGDLTVNGNYAVELNGPTPGNTASNHDQTVVSGSTTIGAGATLSIDFGSYTPVLLDRFFIIASAGTTPVTGNFVGLSPAGGSAIPFSILGVGNGLISYVGDSASNSVTGGNDVVIYNFVVPEPTTLAGAAAVGLVALRRRRK
jgi:fibronectin-binding autotransporter adhesin